MYIKLNFTRSTPLQTSEEKTFLVKR